jgi:hypothetical protein
MTKRQPPNPGGLNNHGKGTGMKLVTKPITKKRGASAKPESKATDLIVARTGLDTSVYGAAEQIDPNKPLTDKQKLFVKHWAAGESITSASARAGYGDGATFAYRMVRMPNVLALYDAEKLAYEASCQMTRKRVMDGLLESIDMAKLMAEPSTMVSGWREIAKMCGYMAPVQIKHTVTEGGRQDRLERMTDAELEAMVGAPIPEDVLHALDTERGDA